MLSAISEKGGQWGYINTKGEFVITPQFDAVTEFSDGYASVSVGGKWGIIDSSGSYVVSPQYGYISRFSKGVAVVVNFDVDDDGNDKYGLIDTKGKLLLPITYDEIGSSNFDELIDYTDRSFRNIIKEDEREAAEENIWNQINALENDNNDYLSFSLKRKDSTVIPVLDHGRLINSRYYGNIFYCLLYTSPSPRD